MFPMFLDVRVADQLFGLFSIKWLHLCDESSDLMSENLYVGTKSTPIYQIRVVSPSPGLYKTPKIAVDQDLFLQEGFVKGQ